MSNHFRVLALSATPGSDARKIQTVSHRFLYTMLCCTVLLHPSLHSCDNSADDQNDNRKKSESVKREILFIEYGISLQTQ